MILETLIENDLLQDILNTLIVVLDHIEDETASGRDVYNRCADLQMKLYNKLYGADTHTRKLAHCEIDGKMHLLMQYINSDEVKI